MPLNSSPLYVGVRIAKLLAAELLASVERNEFGVIVRDVSPIDFGVLIKELADPRITRNQRLRLALVDKPTVIEQAVEEFPSLKALVATTEEEAVEWRNNRLRTIAVISNKPLTKAASLREFRPIGERDLARRLCDEERDKAEVSWLRTLWDAIARGKTLRIALADIVEFAVALSALSPTDRSTRASGYLHLLKLFPDQFLADERSDQRLLRRLQQNRELVSAIKRANSDDWSRIRAYVKTLSGADRTAANQLAKKLRDNPESNGFTDIEFEDANRLWRAKSSTPGRVPRSGGVERVEIERTIGRMLLDNDESRLGDIADEIKQIIQAALEDESHAGAQDVRNASGGDTVSTLEVRRDILTTVSARSTESDWGGIIEVAAERAGLLTEATVVKSWKPFTISSIQSDLKKFTDEGLAPESVLEALDRLVKCRLKLLPLVHELAVSPVVALAAVPDALEQAEEYLTAYEQLLRQLHSCYGEMVGAADSEAEGILGSLLCLEFYVFRAESTFEVVISPLHPLFLWRSATLVREIRGLGKSLSVHEIETVEEACAEHFQFLQVLVLPRQATGAEGVMLLGQAGAMGRLPVFREAPRGMLETDGMRTVGDLAQHLARLRPFVRPGLQVVLINVPRPSRFVDELLSRLDLETTNSEETYWGLHIRVRYTQDDTRGWATESDLEEEVQELLATGEERGLASLAIQAEVSSWAKLQKELKERPAHLTVVFDPFEVRSTPVARAQAHSLSPWMPTMEYRFNKIRKEVQVIPVAEEHVFGSYLQAASLVYTALQRKTAAHLPQVKEVKDLLDEIALSSTWTVVADPHRVPLARLGPAEVIDRRIERGRQLTCFGHDLSPFRRRLDEQLRLTHFSADQVTIEQLVRDLVAMEPNGILGLGSTNHDKQVKGSLGKLIAVRWYRTQQPSGLAVSLDTPNAARWLVAGHHSKEKADLLGLREEDGELVIDVIEVKAHDEALPYSISNGQIDGKAVGQVLATMQALAEVFSPDASSPLAKPRREVLREHVYTALLRDQDPAFVERWHALLQDVFEGKVPVKLAGRIVHVQLASVARKESKTFKSASGVPIVLDTLSASDVGLVLRSMRPVAEGIKIADLEGGMEAHDRMEPSAALSLLAVAPKSAESAPSAEGSVGAAASSKATSSEPEITPASAVVASSRQPETPEKKGLFLNVQLGREHASSADVVWQPSRQSNGFFLILGASGSGKTETLKVLASSISTAGVPVLVCDFHGDVVLQGAESILLSSGTTSTMGLNPMELDSKSAEESGLYDQRATLRTMIQRAVPALGHRQGSILREVFDAAYQRAGILDDKPATWCLPPPNFGDILDLLNTWAEDPARKSQKAAIEGCVAAVQELFDHPIFSRTNQVSVEEMLTRSMRLDLSKLPDQVRYVATETLLRKIFRVLRLRGPIPVQPVDDAQRFRLFVVIDEAKILSLGGSGDRERADNILNQLITEARKFGLGLILASQMSEHFSEEVRANASTWLVLKPMDIREAKKNAPNVSVDPEDLIRLGGRGDGYYRDRSATRARRIQVRPLS